MKLHARLLIGCFFLSVVSTSFSQTCVDGLKFKSYDSIVIGSGNAFHTFTFPKFDATLGSLMEIKLESEITLLYSFELENRESITINNYRVRVTRDDEISSPALLNPFINSQVRTYGPYSLTAWDGSTGTGTDYVIRGPLYVMNHAVVSQTVFNTADYLGPGSVDFDYTSTTYSAVLGSVNYTFNATAQDTIHFRITYTYCPTWFLKADISLFNAIKKDEKSVDLHWITQNEENERIYEIQKSYNGRNFETIAKRPSQPDATQTGTYRYSYSIQPNDKQPKLIFRLKQIEKDGIAKYSALRVVEINKNDQQVLRIYPNPARYQTQLVFNNKKRSNWQVEIYSMNGTRVKQYSFSNVLTARLDGLQLLSNGIYIIKATDKNTLQGMKERLVILN